MEETTACHKGQYEGCTQEQSEKPRADFIVSRVWCPLVPGAGGEGYMFSSFEYLSVQGTEASQR